MRELTITEKVKKTLQLEKTGYIPVIPTASAFVANQCS